MSPMLVGAVPVHRPLSASGVTRTATGVFGGHQHAEFTSTPVCGSVAGFSLGIRMARLDAAIEAELEGSADG